MKFYINRQVSLGIILAYVLIIINVVYGIIITPFIIKQLGVAEYGVYKTIAAVSGSLLIFDLGLGSMLLRYISMFRAGKKEEEVSNLIAMSMIQGVLIIIFISVISIIIYSNLERIYINGLTYKEINKVKQLFIFLYVSIVLHIIENIFNGVITGYNRFIVGNGLRLARIMLRIILIPLLIIVIKDSVILVIIDIMITILIILFENYYIKEKLKIKIKLRKWDSSLFFKSSKYMLLMFLTTIVAQVNSNLDNIVIGAIVGSAAVTIYSISLLVFSMFEQLSTAVSGAMLPTISEALLLDDDGAEVRRIIISMGRIQFSLLGAALMGFIIFGKQFIKFWFGLGFDDAYYLSIILMIPALFELCINVILSVLRAKNLLGFRTITIFLTTIMNAIITILGTYYWNYYAAAIGTAISFFVGSLIVMNIYYSRKLNFNMAEIYSSIFRRIWICISLSGSVSYVIGLIVDSETIELLLGVLSFIITYFLTMYYYGWNYEEKFKIKTLLRLV